MKTIEFYGLSDLGLARPNNEDVFGQLPELHFFALADGMGGHRAGEIAAEMAIAHLCDAAKQFTEGDPNLQLKKAIQAANFKIFQKGKEDEKLRGMGTTLCCFLMQGDAIIYAHVGDSRIYRFRHNLTRLTQDHSLRSELIKQGELTEAAAPFYPYKNVITRAIGTNPTVEPEVKTDTVRPGDIYFLCSDGLTDVVPDREIERILEEELPLRETVQKLINTAKQKGGSDNITVVMIKV